MTSVDVELGLPAVPAMRSPTTLTFGVLALVLSERPGRTGSRKRGELYRRHAAALAEEAEAAAELHYRSSPPPFDRPSERSD